MSTAGVSASAPAAVRLVERLVGPDVARDVATYFGIDRGDSAHFASAFGFGPHDGFVMARNWVAGLAKTSHTIVGDGRIDEFSLAFAVDALIRTSRAAVVRDAEPPIATTTYGLRLRVPHARRNVKGKALILPGALPERESLLDSRGALIVEHPHRAITSIFREIGLEFGADTADAVARQLELARRAWEPPLVDRPDARRASDRQ